MNFSLNEEQSLLKDTLHRLLGDHYGFDRRKKYMASADGFSRDMWTQYATMGLMALQFALEDGGLGAGPVETMVTMEEFGRSLVLEPYLETVVLCGGILKRSVPSRGKQKLLTAITEGAVLMALAHDEPVGPPTCAVRLGDAYRLNGVKHLVIGGPAADTLVVSARLDVGQRATALFVVDPRTEGVEMARFVTHDGTHAANVTFDNAVVAAQSMIEFGMDPLDVLEQATDEATAAICAEAAGLMDEALSMTVDYLRTRQQFGVAIGTFQSLRHKVADMYVALEHARSMSITAMLECASPDRLVRRRAVSAAKVQIGWAGRSIGQAAIQLHGAIGMTDEYKVGHLFKRLEAIGRRFGDADRHIELLAACGGAIA
jgi:alkylation response protein AidB-like acyl-CoA dehydrogenase